MVWRDLQRCMDRPPTPLAVCAALLTAFWAPAALATPSRHPAHARTKAAGGARPAEAARRAWHTKTAAPATLDYNRDIRPILSEKCFPCHGQDATKRQAGLRLDIASVATGKLAAGDRALVPGQPAKSAAIQRIFSRDAMLRMPPPDSQKVLLPEEKAALMKWVAEGARYEKHWAFVAPVRPRLPAVHLKSWPHNGIDTFILARLERDGLRPSPPADRYTLLRRVSLDLTGIPPSPAEVEAFVHDRSRGAYRRVVDRLLASPQFGEQMARGWLDRARYADSSGYQSDWERYQWRWRDWVIQAFNRDLPYDQFVVDQIAGDMLPNATLDEKIASGFNRNHRLNTEGGIIPEEWRVENVIDRTSTTGEVFMGLTLGCARCHDHKYDPIKQREFYSLCAYFNNVPESGIGVEAPGNTPPVISAPTNEQSAERAMLLRDQKQAQTRLAGLLSHNEAAAASWSLPANPTDKRLHEGLVARYVLSAHPLIAEGAGPAPRLIGAVTATEAHATGALACGGGSYVDLGTAGDFDTHTAFSYGAWVNPTSGDGAPISRMDSAAAYRGWDILLSGGRPMVHIIHAWPTDALKIVCKQTIPMGQWTHLLVTYDGTGRPGGLKLYINGMAAPCSVEVDALKGSIRTPVSTRIGGRTGSDPFSGSVDDAFLYHRALDPQEAVALYNSDPARVLLAIPAARRSPEVCSRLVVLWSEGNDPQYQQVARDEGKSAEQLKILEGQIPTVMVMEEMPKPRDCYVLVRGEYDKHGARVTEGIPSAFPPLPRGAPNNRLGFARWVASPANPLTARVEVNRLWASLFGTGIVSTQEDFGTRSEFPSHPRLLDWLATELVRQGWSIKSILREMVLSSTYKQSSHVTPLLVARDPDNRLLARGPRFRLSAETIRDQALAASGLLTEKIGGPPVRPYQPDGVWDEISVYGNLHNYKHDTGPNLYRRSLYTVWKRTSPPPLMTLFDAPSREVCTLRRARTDTPLQALALMDDVTFTEAARVTAQRVLESGDGTTRQRAQDLFMRLLCRPPTMQELRILTSGIARWEAEYRAQPEQAAQLISIGDTPVDGKVAPARLAAYTMTASMILNMDEMVTKD